MSQTFPIKILCVAMCVKIASHA